MAFRMQAKKKQANCLSFRKRIAKIFIFVCVFGGAPVQQITARLLRSDSVSDEYANDVDDLKHASVGDTSPQRGPPDMIESNLKELIQWSTHAKPAAK